MYDSNTRLGIHPCQASGMSEDQRENDPTPIGWIHRTISQIPIENLV